MKHLFTFLLLLAFATGLANHAQAQKPSVLVIHTLTNYSNYYQDVQSKLIATNQFSSVGVFGADAGTPTLAQLQAYDAVLVYSETPNFANRNALGDVLVDYINTGKGVVRAVFTLTTGLSIGGAFNNDTYKALSDGSQQNGPRLTLGTIAVPSHPIVQGVNSFDGGQGSYRSNSSLLAGATLIASWSDGTPLIAVKNSVGTNQARRADLNFLPTSSDINSSYWQSNTDGAKIMANALFWASKFVTCADFTATLMPSGQLTCTNKTVTLTAGGGLTGATYQYSAGATNNGASATVTADGPYSVTVTNPGGCSSVATTSVSSNTTAPTATLTNNGPITCNQRTVTLTAGGGGSYAFSAGATPSGNTATVTNEGLYSVTVTSANGCTATQTTQVASNTTAPNATLTNNGPITANNPTATLTAGGGGTYAFSQGASQQNGGNTATVNNPGNYQVTVTGANGCTATASTVVTGAVSGSSCRNGSGVITVVASGTPVKYEWYRNSINSARLTENPAQVKGTSTASLTLVNQQVTADYYVRVTDANGSAVVYGPFRFTVNLNCNIYARTGVEEVELRISLLGNPLQGEQLKAVISGAEGRALNVQLLDLQGRAVRQQAWQQADQGQTVEWSLGGQANGVYLLQATTPDQRQSIKVVKQ